MSEVIYLRGEGGAVFKMATPVSENIRKRWDAGDLVQVNADGTELTEKPARKPRARAAKAEPDGDAG